MLHHFPFLMRNATSILMLCAPCDTDFCIKHLGLISKDASLGYATEHVAAALKAARQQKGLSQRALSKLSGVPQAHISKIESNAVDLRLSSLIAIARALDLEVALLPRKALPAMQSLSRMVGTNHAAPTVSKDLARAIQAMARVPMALNKNSDLARLRTQLKVISSFPLPQIDVGMMRKIREATEAINAVGGTKPVRDALKYTTALCNAMVHRQSHETLSMPRPAYSLDEGEDG